MKARFADVPEAVQNTLEVAEKCNVEIEFGKLHYPVFHPPEHFTREGFLRQWLAEGLHRRYTIHARAEGKEFIVEGIDDPRRLPTYQLTSLTRPLPGEGESRRLKRTVARRLASTRQCSQRLPLSRDRVRVRATRQSERPRRRRRHQSRDRPPEPGAGGHREDRLHFLLPDRRRFHSLRAQQGHFVRGARLAPPVRSSPTCWRLRTWTRFATGCCSSAS